MTSVNTAMQQPDSIAGLDESLVELRILLQTLAGEIDLDENGSRQVEGIRKMLEQSESGRDLSAVIAGLTNVIAQNRYRYEAERKAMHELIGDTKELLLSVSHSLQAVENQAHSSFQGAQKTGNALERQVQDIAYRVRTSSKLEGMKVWLEQRLAIVDARLDDYQSQGVQQHTGLTNKLQKMGQGARELNDAVERLIRDWIEGTRAQFIDHLTGVGNRLDFEKKIAGVIAERAYPGNEQYILQLWDVDHLSEINRLNGRKTGDQVLRLVAEVLATELGGRDDIYRLDNDRFAVLSNGFEAEQLHLVADRLCEMVERAVLVARQVPIHFTVSGGYTELRRADTEATIFQRVLSALGQAKRAGGNCCWYSDDKR